MAIEGEVPKKWYLAQALHIIRQLQPQLKPYGYHVCLGGSVLNKGESEKDLDLYFLPLQTDAASEKNRKLLAKALLTFLELKVFGASFQPFGGMDYPDADDDCCYYHKGKFNVGLRIDVFIG